MPRNATDTAPPPEPARRILGIDTSLRSTGFGIIQTAGQRARALRFGTIRNPQRRCLSECLLFLEGELNTLIVETMPEAASIEGIFYCRNVRSALLLGHARGVALTCCARAALPVYEYEPRRVKQAVVGHGGAEKHQVQHMVAMMLGLTEPPEEDEADALALALCHWHAQGKPSLQTSNPI